MAQQKRKGPGEQRKGVLVAMGEIVTCLGEKEKKEEPELKKVIKIKNIITN